MATSGGAGGADLQTSPSVIATAPASDPSLLAPATQHENTLPQSNAGEGGTNGLPPVDGAALADEQKDGTMDDKVSPPSGSKLDTPSSGRILHGFSVAAYVKSSPEDVPASAQTRGSKLIRLPREMSLPSSGRKEKPRAGGMRVILPDQSQGDDNVNATPATKQPQQVAVPIVAASASLYEESSPEQNATSGEEDLTPLKPAAPGTPLGRVVEPGQEHTGRWTKEEHEAFLSALQMYGKEWKKVAAKVKTRTVVQTRTHAQKYFQKLQKVMKNSDEKEDSTTVGIGTAAEAKKATPGISSKRRSGGTRQRPSGGIGAPPTGGMGAPPTLLSHQVSQGAAAEAAAHLMAQMSSGRTRSSPPPPQASTYDQLPSAQSFSTPATATSGMQDYSQAPESYTSVGADSDAYSGGAGYRATTSLAKMPMKIVAPAPDDAMKRGNFPEPSPAACGKRKLAEIAAAQMLAGVATSGGSSARRVPAMSGHATPPAPPPSADRRAPNQEATVKPLRLSDNFKALSSSSTAPAPQRPTGSSLSLQIVNPDTLGVSFDDSAGGGGKRKRGIHGQPSPSTPWDGELEALVSEVKSKGAEKSEEVNRESVLGMPDLPNLDADEKNGDDKDSALSSHPLRGPSSRSDLHKAVCYGSVDKVSRFLESLAKDGTTTEQGKGESQIKIVFEHDTFGFFPLHSAAAIGMINPNQKSFENAAEITQLLLSAGADASCCDAKGNTPLHWAARAGNDKAAQVLIMKSCPLDAQNEDGETALHWSLRAGAQGLNTANVLLQNGARASIFNREFKRPLDVAARDFPDTGKGASIALRPSTEETSNTMAEASKMSERRQARKNLLMHSPQSRTLVLHHPECLDHVPKSPLDWEAPDRVKSIMARILSVETQPDNSSYLHPHEVTVSTDFDRAPLELLSRVHSAEYLAFVNDLSKELERRRKKQVVEENEANNAGFSGAGAKTGSDPHVVPFTPMVQRTMMRESESAVKKGAHSDTSFSAGSLRAARRAAGAVQHAVDRVLVGRNRNAFCVVRPPGHHAGVNGLLSGGESCGFCIFNSVAAGAMHALSDESHRPKCERCAIVDIDAHHGNGTEEIVRKCHDPGRLLFFSVHLFDHDRRKSSGSYKFYPGTGDEDDVAHNIINVPIAPLWREKEVLQSTSVSTVNTGSSAGSAISAPPVSRHNTRQKAKRAAAAASRSSSPTRSVAKDMPSDGEKPGSVPTDSQLSDTDASSLDGNSSRATSLKGAGQRSSTPRPAHYNIGVGRQAYRRAIQQRLLPALRAFNPDLILISSGFDASRGDVGNARHYAGGRERMGLDLEPEDYAWTTKKILEIADICCHGRVVSVLEGGYGRTPVASALPDRPQGSSSLKKDMHHLDKTVFTECAVRHLQALVDPFDDEMRHTASDTS